MTRKSPRGEKNNLDQQFPLKKQHIQISNDLSEINCKRICIIKIMKK